MNVEAITIPPIMEKCYVVYDGTDALIFDPGGNSLDIKKLIEDKNLNILAIFITHGHFDHIGAVADIKRAYNVSVYAHEGDLDMIHECNERAAGFGLGPFEVPDVDSFVEDNMELKFNDFKVKVIYTPGHSRGSVCYYIEHAGILLSGDTLFYEAVGRTDLWGGDWHTLEESVKNKLYTLPDETAVYPGHGISTTIGHEKKFNPVIKS